jgi:hypothetical protein
MILYVEVSRISTEDEEKKNQSDFERDLFDCVKINLNENIEKKK